MLSGSAIGLLFALVAVPSVHATTQEVSDLQHDLEVLNVEVQEIQNRIRNVETELATAEGHRMASNRKKPSRIYSIPTGIKNCRAAFGPEPGLNFPFLYGCVLWRWKKAQAWKICSDPNEDPYVRNYVCQAGSYMDCRLIVTRQKISNCHSKFYPETRQVIANVENIEKELQSTIRSLQQEAASKWNEIAGVTVLIEGKEKEELRKKEEQVVEEAYTALEESCDLTMASTLWEQSPDRQEVSLPKMSVSQCNAPHWAGSSSNQRRCRANAKKAADLPRARSACEWLATPDGQRQLKAYEAERKREQAALKRATSFCRPQCKPRASGGSRSQNAVALSNVRCINRWGTTLQAEVCMDSVQEDCMDRCISQYKK